MLYNAPLQRLIESVGGKGELYVTLFRRFAHKVLAGNRIGFVDVQMMRFVGFRNVGALDGYVFTVYNIFPKHENANVPSLRISMTCRPDAFR